MNCGFWFVLFFIIIIIVIIIIIIMHLMCDTICGGE